MKVLSILGLLGLVVGIYAFLIRPGQLTWGATDADLSRVMPGDEIPVNATFYATRAVTIAGTPQEIWPWLVQWGYGRAGFYGYDVLENIGSPSGLRSADRIIPELQSRAVGDRVLMNDLAWFTVQAIRPNQNMVLTGTVYPPTPTSVMTWALYPIDASHTRLVNRFRFQHAAPFPLVALNALTEFGDHVALKKILLGIKGRVEGNIELLGDQIAEVASWLLILVELIVAVCLIFRRRKWGRAWLLALLAALAFLFALYSPAEVWIKLLLGVGILVGLVGLRYPLQLDKIEERDKAGATS
jgi:hypothetical protein